MHMIASVHFLRKKCLGFVFNRCCAKVSRLSLQTIFNRLSISSYLIYSIFNFVHSIFNCI